MEKGILNMKASKFLLILSVFMFFVFGNSGSALAENKCNCGGEVPVFKSRLVEENLILTSTASNLSTESIKPCDRVALKVLENVNYCNKVVIPCGSLIEGKVVKVKKNLMLRTDAYIDFMITNIKVSPCCNICLENDPIELRIVDPHYKGGLRRILQRAPIMVAGPAVSIPVGAATGLAGGVVFAITVGAQATAGFLSGLVDPDIDKTRIDGAITRAVEGTPIGTFLIVAETGYGIDAPACNYITIRFDDISRQKILGAMQRTVATGCNY